MTYRTIEWQDKANCKGLGTDIFFYDELPYEEQAPKRKKAAKLCATCEVQEACLNYALREEIEDGIWGGLSYIRRLKHVL